MRRVLPVVALVAALLLGPVSAAPAQEGGGRLELLAQTSWVAAGDSFDLRLGLDGAAAGDLQITIHSRLRSRSAFALTLDGRTRGTAQRVRVPVEDVTGADGDLRVSLAPAGSTATGPGVLPLPELRPGVHPVTVAALDEDGRTLDRFVTHLVRLPDEGELTPLSVAWIHRVGAPPATPPGTELDPDTLAELEVLVDAVDADPALDLSLELTPETLQQLDATGLEPLRQAVEGGDQLLATPFVDIDPVALLDAGVGSDIRLQRQLGEEVLFSALGTRGDPRTWSADRALTPTAVARLRDLGVTRLVVPEDSLEPLDDDVSGGTTLTRPFELRATGDDVVRAAAVDAGLLAHFRAGDDQVLAAHQFLADLAVLFFDFPGTTRGVVVRPPSRWTPSEAFLDTVLPAVADLPIVRSTTLEQLFDGVDPLEDDDRPVVRRTASPVRAGALPARRLATAHQALDELAALAGPETDVVARMRRRLLLAESTRVRAASRDELLASVLETRDDVEHRVRLDQRSVRLTAREGTIPLTLVNDNRFPVTVELVLSSDKLEFRDAGPDDRSRHTVRLALEPGTHTRAIPVRTRASGTFQVRTALHTTDGQLVRRGQFTITSSAFSGVGVVLSIGAGLFLVLWWGSHWRTVRRDRRLVEAPG